MRVATMCAILGVLLCGCSTGLSANAILVDTDSTSGNTQSLAPFTVSGPWQIEYTVDCTKANSEGVVDSNQFTLDVFDGDDNSTAFENPQTVLVSVKRQGTLNFTQPGNYYVHVGTQCDWTLQVLDLSGGPVATATPRVARPAGTVPLDVTFASEFGPYNCNLTGTSALLCVVGDGTTNTAPFGALTMHRTVAEQAATADCSAVTTTGVLTAASGDTISVQADKGQACKSSGVAPFTFTVTGGTGIFSGATGSGTITDAHLTSDHWTGTITFPAATPTPTTAPMATPTPTATP